MGDKCGDRSSFFTQLDLVKSPLYVYLNEDCTPVKIMQNSIHCGNGVSLSDHCTVCLPHINTQTQVTIGFRNNNYRRNLRGWFLCLLNYIKIYQLIKLRLKGTRRIDWTTCLTCGSIEMFSLKSFNFPGHSKHDLYFWNKFSSCKELTQTFGVRLKTLSCVAVSLPSNAWFLFSITLISASTAKSSTATLAVKQPAVF